MKVRYVRMASTSAPSVTTPHASTSEGSDAVNDNANTNSQSRVIANELLAHVGYYHNSSPHDAVLRVANWFFTPRLLAPKSVLSTNSGNQSLELLLQSTDVALDWLTANFSTSTCHVWPRHTRGWRGGPLSSQTAWRPKCWKHCCPGTKCVQPAITYACWHDNYRAIQRHCAQKGTRPTACIAWPTICRPTCNYRRRRNRQLRPRPPRLPLANEMDMDVNRERDESDASYSDWSSFSTMWPLPAVVVA